MKDGLVFSDLMFPESIFSDLVFYKYLKKTSRSYVPIFSMICFTQNSNLTKGFADCVFGPFCD